MDDDQEFLCALYGDDGLRVGLVRELERLGIAATLVGSEELPESKVPEWFNGRAGVSHYLLVPHAQSRAAAVALRTLTRICLACDLVFPEEFGRCPACHTKWGERVR